MVIKKSRGNFSVPPQIFCVLFIFFLTRFSSDVQAQSSVWTHLNGPYGGDITGIVCDKAGNVYAATEFNGVYRSTNNGQNWEQINNGLDWSSLTSLVADTSGTLFAGSPFSGLFKTTNQGNSWTKTTLHSGAQSVCIISGNRLCVGGIDSVFISTDRGETWSMSRISDTAVAVTGLAQDGNGKIYACLQAVYPKNTDPFGGGVFFSTDSGRTWKPDGMSLTSVISIATEESGKVFIIVGSGILSGGVKDTNWTRDVLGLPDANVSDFLTGPAGKVAVASILGFYVYQDSGSYWKNVSPGLSSVTITAAFYNPIGISYLGTQFNGIFSLTGTTSGWVQCGISRAATTSICFDQGGTMYVGTDNGIYKPSPQAGTWIRASSGLFSGSVFKIDTSSFARGIFAATSAGLFFSTDKGSSWNIKSSLWAYDMAQAGIFGTYLYMATTGGILYSTDGGDNWNRPAGIGFPSGAVFSLLGYDYLYAGTSNNGVFVTTDNGNFWTQTGVSSPFMFCSVKALAESGIGLLAGTDTAGAFLTTDDGQNWTHIPTITASNVACFLVQQFFKPPIYNGTIFAGTLGGGVFASKDFGQTWKPFNGGLTDLNVHSLRLDSLGYLYAATDSGIFETVGSVTEISVPPKLPISISLEQNYPNPFNPTTVISYHLSAVSGVTLKVFDVLGREVRTLVDRVNKPGIYEVKFDGSGLSSGVYFYRLVARDYVKTRKMVLVK